MIIFLKLVSPRHRVSATSFHYIDEQIPHGLLWFDEIDHEYISDRSRPAAARDQSATATEGSATADRPAHRCVRPAIRCRPARRSRIDDGYSRTYKGDSDETEEADDNDDDDDDGDDELDRSNERKPPKDSNNLIDISND